jgi:hypothetical protein
MIAVNGAVDPGEVTGPGASCAEEWSVDNIGEHNVSFYTSITKGSEAICGYVDTFESEVTVTYRTEDTLSVEWVEMDSGTIIGNAILYRR